MIEFENKPTLGSGIYTPREISRILRLPDHKVNRWIDLYWDGELGREYERTYSWRTGNSKAVGFHTLIEFYTMMQLSEAGVKPREVIKAHKYLSVTFNTAFPFAQQKLLSSIKSDGKKIYFKNNGDILTLDGTKQLNLQLIEYFFEKLDFDQEQIATRFWPLGKEKSIVIDPSRKFGHPVIDKLNIYPETIFNHVNAGDPKKYVAHIYDLTLEQVENALEYCKAA